MLKSKGPACLVTTPADPLGSVFSSGFNKDLWGKENKLLLMETISKFAQLLVRILMFPMPTICVINGQTSSAGLLFALAHDMRIMNAKSKGNIGLLDQGYAQMASIF